VITSLATAHEVLGSIPGGGRLSEFICDLIKALGQHMETKMKSSGILVFGLG